MNTSTYFATIWYDNPSGRIYLTGIVTPEPGTFILAALGLLGLGLYRRRKR